MKLNIFFLTLCLFVGLTSCRDKGGDNPETTCDLKGTWNAVSVIEDGEQALGGDDIDMFTMEYKNGNRFTWSIRWDDGYQDNLTGSFTESECTELQLNFDANDEDVGTINFTLNINGSNLTIRGWIDGERYEIEAIKID